MTEPTGALVSAAAVARCGDPACPCNHVLHPHHPEPACTCGCGLTHCVTCGEVWPCTTETHQRHSAATETGDPA